VAATVVIEDASFESGARLAGLVAQSLEHLEPVHVILRDDGPLSGWLAEHVHGKVDVCNRGNFPYEAPIAGRISAAASFLENDSSDIAYVYGLGATDFALAARLQDRRIVLHVYQSESQIEHLLARDQTKRDCARFCDALLTMGTWRRDNLSRLLGSTPSRVHDTGYRLDFEWLSRVVAEAAPQLVNCAAAPLQADTRFVVGGCGAAEKDAALFLSLAGQYPQFDFAWLGGKRPRHDEDASNGAIPPAGASNVYAGVDGRTVWAVLGTLGACVLCGRQRDAMLPLAASAIGIPVIGFTGSGVTELLAHYGILCHGDPDPAVISKFLNRIAAEAGSRATGGLVANNRDLDIGGCVETVLQMVADIRLTEAG
jgi:hypothetical protein